MGCTIQVVSPVNNQFECGLDCELKWEGIYDTVEVYMKSKEEDQYGLIYSGNQSSFQPPGLLHNGVYGWYVKQTHTEYIPDPPADPPAEPQTGVTTVVDTAQTTNSLFSTITLSCPQTIIAHVFPQNEQTLVSTTTRLAWSGTYSIVAVFRKAGITGTFEPIYAGNATSIPQPQVLVNDTTYYWYLEQFTMGTPSNICLKTSQSTIDNPWSFTTVPQATGENGEQPTDTDDEQISYGVQSENELYYILNKEIVLNYRLDYDILFPRDLLVIDSEHQYKKENCIGTETQTINILLKYDPQIFNPIIGTSQYTKIMWDSLLDITDGIILGDNLCLSHEITTNGFKFNMRKGLLWSDSEVLNAEDVKWTFEHIWFVKYHDLFCGLDGDLPIIQIVDDEVIYVHYSELYVLPLDLFGGMPILPKHILEDYTDTQLLEDFQNISNLESFVCNGPMIPYSGYISNKIQIFVQNRKYHRIDTQGYRLPYIHSVQFTISNDTQNLYSSLQQKTNVFHVFEFQDYMNFITKDDLYILDHYPNLSLSNKTISETQNILFFNYNSNEYFRNQELRRAISYQINYSQISSMVYDDVCYLVNSLLDVTNQISKYNLSIQLSILEQQGFELDLTTNLLYYNDQQVILNISIQEYSTNIKMIQELIQLDLKKIGIIVNLIFDDYQNIIDQITLTGAWDQQLLNIKVGFALHNYFNLLTISGINHFWNYNPEVKSFINTETYQTSDIEDQISDELIKYQTNQIDNLGIINELFFEDIPFIFICRLSNYYTHSLNIHNIDVTNNFDFIRSVFKICGS